MKRETKLQARNRHRKELLAEGITIGCRKPSSARLNHPIEMLLSGTCLCCRLPAYKCTCYGEMSEGAHKRFHESSKAKL